MQWRFFSKLSQANRPVASNDECGEIEPLLSLYSDGMTSPAETRRVEAHLAGCESCRKAHFWMRATYEVISHRPEVLPPPDMMSRIQAAIAQADAPAAVPVRMRFNPRPAYALAASLVLAAAVIIPLSRTGHQHAVQVGRLEPNPVPTANVTPPAPVAVTPPANVQAPVVKPSATHKPTQLASNAHATHAHTPTAVPDRLPNIEASLPRPHAVSTHPTSKPQPVERHLPTPHASAPVHPDNTMLATAPKPRVPGVGRTHVHPAPSTDRVALSAPEHVETPAPVHATQPEPERVAVAPQPTPEPEPVHVAAAPEPAPTVILASAHSRGVNDDLRDAVRNLRRTALGNVSRSQKVAISMPHDDTINIVGSTIN